MKTGIELIAEERATHIQKGWTPQHDDHHAYREIAVAASQLILDGWAPVEDQWGLVEKTKLEGGRVRQLVVAGALIAAEIDRLQRLKEVL